MQCGTCGSQDVTLKRGISKSGKNVGKPWTAYDCNEKECKNEKGYPSRTFVPTPRQAGPVQQAGGNLGDLKSIVGKLDLIINALKKKGIIIPDTIEREDISEIEETPF